MRIITPFERAAALKAHVETRMYGGPGWWAFAIPPLPPAPAPAPAPAQGPRALAAVPPGGDRSRQTQEEQEAEVVVRSYLAETPVLAGDPSSPARVLVGEWMDGWMDVWLDVCMYGWMDG